MSEHEKKNIVSKDKLLEAGVYFGHKKSMWNPKMKPYINKVQKGTHIIDIDKTKRTLEFAYSIIKNLATRNASFVFVGTRKQAKETIKENALRTNSYYVSERWLGGTLTNSRTIFQRVRRMEDLERLEANNFENYTKKEGLLFSRELFKLHKNLQGIRKMRYKPNIMIIADPAADQIAVKEAKKLGVKTIGIVDTNTDPSLVDIAIPANDDSKKSVTLIITILADAIAAAKGGAQLFAYQDDSAIVLPEEPKKVRAPRKFFNSRKFTKPYQSNRDTNSVNVRKEINTITSSKPAAEKVVKPEVKEEVKAVKSTQETKTEESSSSNDISKMKLSELKTLAKEKGLKGYSSMKKSDLVEQLSN